MHIIRLADRRPLLAGRASQASLPPPPHTPAERLLVDVLVAEGGPASLCAWQVRMFDPAGRFHLYFSTTGFAHLQLWNPWFGISLLTPSRLTAGDYEAFPLAGWKYRERDYGAMVRAVEARYATRLPSAERIAVLVTDYGACAPARATPLP